MNASFEDEILDHDFKQPKNYYSKRSFNVFVIILSLVIVRILLMLFFRYTFSVGALFHFSTTIINITIKLLTVYGIYVALVSVTEREPTSAFKIIGLIGNILAFTNLILFLLLSF